MQLLEGLVGAVRRRKWIFLGGALLAAFILGYGTRGGGPSRGEEEAAETVAEETSTPTIWTCAMHPQIRLPEPGQCPICFMDLIPLETGAGDDMGPRTLVMSETARRLAEIQTSPVERKFVEAEVRMVGKVELDETRLAYLTAWVPGRLDRLYVDYTGVEVRKGDHMVDIYSPELLAAHEELLQAIEASKELEASDVGIVRSTALATIDAVRDRLRLWGLTPGQVRELETSTKPRDHITIFAPMGGVVIHKNALEGMYVDVGTRIYTIADLSQVWVKLDAYESDLEWIRYGQDVEFTTEAYPGEAFHGRIVFIDPVLNPVTRTVKVRVNLENRDGKLKPDMFVRGIVRSNLAGSGRIMDPDLAGKWIGPMHPEIVKDEPGTCDICGMKLVSTESLGYAPPGEGNPPLVIPASAPLLTGTRAVVYVQTQDSEKISFEGREVVLGPRAGDYYLVVSGLSEGELVVTNGNFKIDSALQIQAKPSMMSPEGGIAPPAHHHGTSPPAPGGKPGAEEQGKAVEGGGTAEVPPAFLESLDPLYEAYFELQGILAGDDREGAAVAMDRVAEAGKKVDGSLLDERPHSTWMDLAGRVARAADAGKAVEDLDRMRGFFRDLSLTMIEIEAGFGHAGSGDHYRYFCPMAFENEGAMWLQASKETQNPYLGSAMPKCGDVKESYHGMSHE